MSELTSLASGVAGRYATALFSICKEEGKLKSLNKDADSLAELLEKSLDFRSLIESPIYKREEQEGALTALASHLKVCEHTKNLLCLLAKKGRIFILPDFINDVKKLLINERDELGVEIVSADKLSSSQIVELENKLSALLKKTVKVQVKIEKSLISGIIIKLGSKMIDTSIKSKLIKLKTKMKEVS